MIQPIVKFRNHFCYSFSAGEIQRIRWRITWRFYWRSLAWISG